MLAIALAALLAIPRPQAVNPALPAGSAQADGFLAEFRTRLKSHGYFSKVVLSEKALSPTITLFAHVPQVAAPDWEAKLVAERSPWLLRAEKRFVELFAQPMGLTRRADTPVSVVCTLQTAGDYVNYVERARLVSPFRDGAHFDRRQRWTVMYESGGPLSPGWRRTSQMAEFVVALAHAHAPANLDPVEQEFPVAGIAGYMCEELGATPDSVGMCKPAPSQLAALVNTLARPESAYCCILRLDELADHASWERYWKLTETRAKEVNAQLGDSVAGEAFHSQGVLWTHFLMEGNQGRDRARFLAFLRHAMEGKGGGAALRGAFEGVQLDQLSREFLTWAVALDAARRKSPALAPGTIEGMFKGAPVLAKTAPGGANPAPAVSAPKGFDVQRLRTPAGELETQHGLALARAAAGHLGDAAKRLGELAPLAQDSTERDRLERERTRLAALDATRTAILKERIASAKKLQFSLPDKKLVVSVRALEGEWMMLGENRQGLERLPLSDFSLELLAKELPNPAPEAWMKPYLQLLTNAGKPVKIPAEERALTDLRADAVQVADRLAQGLVALEFEALADRGLPRDATAALDAVDALRKLLATRARSPLVLARRDALREYSREALGAALRLEDVPSLFGGQCELLPDGQVTWTLQFEKESDAALFTPIKDGWQNLRTYLTVEDSEIEPKLEPRKGAIAVRGSGAWITPAAFRTVSSARARGKHMWDDERPDSEISFYVSLGYREPQRYVAVSCTATMIAFDAETNAFAKEFRTTPVNANVPYEATLTRLEGKIHARCGDYSAAIDDVVETAGHIAFFSQYRGFFELDSVSVTGVPDLDLLRPAFVQRELAKLGL
ncbi:MAG: hypothetical protein NTV21_04860 [Planctomycetota bacterium]|nr:hypothetical protein [Planctomycetota bacterium]